MGLQPFRFHEDLVLRAVGKAGDLVFEGRAIARTHALDAAVVHGRAVQVLTDDGVCGLIGVRDMAVDLLRVHLAGARKRKYRRGRVPRLGFHPAVINAAAVQAGRCTCLQAPDTERPFTQALRQGQGRWVARTPGGILSGPHMDLAA